MPRFNKVFTRRRIRMTAKIMDGKALAEKIRAEIAQEVAARAQNGKSIPGLATVLVGENPASQVYVRMKHRTCKKLGMRSFSHTLPENASQEEVEALIATLNETPEVHGILVQLPLPSHLDEEKILTRIRTEKDVDGFHPANIGILAQKGRTPLFVPCTPMGCLYMLEESNVPIEGAHAVILGRSNIVGLPLSLLLLKKNATVTICHSRTKNLPEFARQADILIAAIGRPEMVRADWIKPGAAVVDVGVNRVDDSSVEKGPLLFGDVAFDEARQTAGWISPVPGGVGPLTIAMLMKNTLRAAQIQDNQV